MTDSDRGDGGGALVRVLIADDNEFTRTGLATLLTASGRIHVCGQAADGRAALELARRSRPDLVLLDVRMPGSDGLSALTSLNAISKVLIVSTTPEHVAAALRRGAAGYLVISDISGPELPGLVLRAARGQRTLSTSAVDVLTRLLGGADDPAPAAVVTGLPSATGPAPLTSREKEVMELVSSGKSNQSIAATLTLSERTVKNHIGRIFMKLGVASRGAAIARWLGTDGGRPGRGEDGQATFPILVLIALFLLAAYGLFGVVKAADLTIEARSASDAAALAGADTLRQAIGAGLDLDQPIEQAAAAADRLQPAVQRDAQRYAARNGADVVGQVEVRGLVVVVTVRTRRRLDVGTQPGLSDRRAGTATSAAEVSLDGDCRLLDPADLPPAGHPLVVTDEAETTAARPAGQTTAGQALVCGKRLETIVPGGTGSPGGAAALSRYFRPRVRLVDPRTAPSTLPQAIDLRVNGQQQPADGPIPLPTMAGYYHLQHVPWDYLRVRHPPVMPGEDNWFSGRVIGPIYPGWQLFLVTVTPGGDHYVQTPISYGPFDELVEVGGCQGYGEPTPWLVVVASPVASATLRKYLYDSPLKRDNHALNNSQWNALPGVYTIGRVTTLREEVPYAQNKDNHVKRDCVFSPFVAIKIGMGRILGIF